MSKIYQLKSFNGTILEYTCIYELKKMLDDSKISKLTDAEIGQIIRNNYISKNDKNGNFLFEVKGLDRFEARYFEVLDVESVKNFADGFQGEIFPLYKEKDGYICLSTCDGELIFAPDEVQEVDITTI